MKNLRHLSVEAATDAEGATDEHIAALAELPLETLRLGKTRITDASLQRLKDATTLRELSFRTSQTTEPGRLRFRKGRRNVKLISPE